MSDTQYRIWVDADGDYAWEVWTKGSSSIGTTADSGYARTYKRAVRKARRRAARLVAQAAAAAAAAAEVCKQGAEWKPYP